MRNLFRIALVALLSKERLKPVLQPSSVHQMLAPPKSTRDKCLSHAYYLIIHATAKLASISSYRQFSS